MFDPSSERDLVERARRGDRAAFGDLVNACREALKDHIRIRLGMSGTRRISIDDVLQETYARALESLPRFEWQGEESILRWLKGIARNVILKRAEEQKRRLLYLDPEVPADSASPSHAMRREERRDRLEAALDSLSPDYRRAIDLARLQGLSIREIARRMDRTPKSVAHLVSRALKKLKEAFGDTESFTLPRGTPGREEPPDERPPGE